jgi:hypothetical protein
MEKQTALFYKLIKAQTKLAMAGNAKELAADLGPIAYQKAVRQYHVAKRAMQRATLALTEAR